MIKIAQKYWLLEKGWVELSKVDNAGKNADIVFCFGERALLEDKDKITEVKKSYPSSPILYISTSGEIINNNVFDGSLTISALYFEKSKLDIFEFTTTEYQTSKLLAEAIVAKINKEGLKHLVIFSEGLNVNGTTLTNNLNQILPENVSVTGGLAGDSASFIKTVVGLNDNPSQDKLIVICFYGDNLHISYSSDGGWDNFGLTRTITKSKDNILYELDGEPALDIYKKYLGDKSKDLPASGLLFPLKISTNVNGNNVDVVRTILKINDMEKSLTFAGDVPEGSSATLMQANMDKIINAAGNAAESALKDDTKSPQFALLVSCVGRKLVLKERTEEELESVRNVLGPDVAMTGFYSYGEICPISKDEKKCSLHNQTMTITLFKED